MTDISATLIENTSKNYIFYIPSTMYAMVENSEFKGIIPKDEYDTIVFYEDKTKIRTSNLGKIILFKVLNKKDDLKNNLLSLLEAKTTLNKAVFDIILNDYQEHLKCHLHITSWMYNHINKFFHDIDETLANAFKFQAQNFAAHSLQIDQHFQLKNEDRHFDTIDVIKNLESTFSTSEVKNNIFKNKNSSKKETLTPLQKSKASIKDEDIDLFLLQTVFNVEL
ncbi:hypothetical protein [Psychroserpens ponticola]|uniref:DUF4238 domain-containing protein n=1 Tax=Psychroserpens ponticola TaxID=2932268 RepID=A0ABY7RTW2_9FLAO|nr:hypothetical protein [Psychroserpens ponticola]WCO00563.1 hypothetical protein MUN68_010835 [Psychroserpens ponticola]